jgi:hypothetical protein
MGWWVCTAPAAWRPPPRVLQVVKGNPVIEYCVSIVLPRDGKLLVSRSEANGGDLTYTEAADLIRDYEAGALHPGEPCGAACALQLVVEGKANNQPHVRALLPGMVVPPALATAGA